LEIKVNKLIQKGIIVSSIKKNNQIEIDLELELKNIYFKINTIFIVLLVVIVNSNTLV